MDQNDGRQRQPKRGDRHADPRMVRDQNIQQRGPAPTSQSGMRPKVHRNDTVESRYATEYAQTTPERQQQSFNFHIPPPVPPSNPRHISATSASVYADESRPVSEIGSEYQPDPNARHGHVSKCTSPGLAKTHHAHAESNGSLLKFAMSHSTPPRTTPRKYSMPLRDSETLPPSDSPRTIAALTEAIKAGLGPRAVTNQKKGDNEEIRMPFAGDPESPTSLYADNHLSVPLSAYQGYNHRYSKPSTISERGSGDFEKSVDRYEKSDSRPEVISPNSFISTSPMLAEQNPGLSSRIPAGKRPPKLDMGAVRDAEARGSMSSLTDLIRRATRVASNLDRGRTASRLGHLDMFGSSREKVGMRGSTYSDVLAAFPPPADTATPGNERPNTMWPYGKEVYMASKSSLGRIAETAEPHEQKPKRKCCGLSPPVFVLILMVAFLLVVAAILIPIFLIVLPNQRKAEALALSCPSSYTCQNGGQKVFVNNACSCICVEGFTGSDCSSPTTSDCVTTNIVDGGKTYANATMGKLVMQILTSDKHGLPLNSTTILASFASNDLSCVSENALVDFDRNTTLKRKRSMRNDMMLISDKFEPYLDSQEPDQHASITSIVPVDTQPTQTLQARQEATQSANGIVFAKTSSDVASPTAALTPSVTSGTVKASSTPKATPPSTLPQIEATKEQNDFASAVVLYVLQTFSQINVAVAANQAITAFFQEPARANNTVQVVSGSQKLQADFASLELIFANGTRIGGSK